MRRIVMPKHRIQLQNQQILLQTGRIQLQKWQTLLQMGWNQLQKWRIFLQKPVKAVKQGRSPIPANILVEFYP